MKIKLNFELTLRQPHPTKKPRLSHRPFTEQAEREAERALAARCYSTAQNYLTALRSLRLFAGRKDIGVEELTPAFVAAYQSWLKNRGLCLNTISCYTRSLRALYNKVEHPEGDPFKEAFTGSTRTRKRSADLADLQRLLAVGLKEGSRMALMRDLFLFSFYCMGMPFVDMAFLRKEQIKDGRISYYRHKTGQPVQIVLEPCIRQIVERYQCPGRSFVFPLISSARPEEAYTQYLSQLRYYNYALKTIARKAGVDKRLTSYVARHTWASIAFRQDVELKVISKALGHTDTQTTLIYIKELDDQCVAEANRQLLRQLKLDGSAAG